ncbi:hypothetical protein [Actinopolyspora mortivallis]|uniref:hypothetical protein n=1 Tax=Actinopolyspora mortivallis TaxID=33906 RepID=UPI0012ECE3F9|nr:hypothetical protein [Actinopolyspora mortivallis]
MVAVMLEYQYQKVRIVGWVVVGIGLGFPAALLPLSALLSTGDGVSFNNYVGWANILSLTVAAVGVIIVIADKIGAISRSTNRNLAELASMLAKEELKQQNRFLSHLLGTDSRDNRPAQAEFTPTEKNYRGRGKRNK